MVYVRKGDALAAIQKYSNVQLDGKLMKIELIGTNLPLTAVPTAVPFNPAMAFPRRGAFSGSFRFVCSRLFPLLLFSYLFRFTWLCLQRKRVGIWWQRRKRKRQRRQKRKEQGNSKESRGA